jgi:hypothetical protein
MQSNDAINGSKSRKHNLQCGPPSHLEIKFTGQGSSMSRLTTFFLGVVVGGASLFIAENYYIVRSNQSFHLVPKVAAKLEFPYHDIRNYSIEDWKNNVSLGAAIVKAKKPDLMVESLTSVQHNFESILESLGGDR